MDPAQLFGDIDPAAYAGLAGVGVIIALTNLSKKFINDERWFPPISVAIGIVWNMMLAFAFNGDYKRGIIAGVISGLSASGLYGMIASSTRVDIKDGKVAGMMATPAARVMVRPTPAVVSPPTDKPEPAKPVRRRKPATPA